MHEEQVHRPLPGMAVRPWHPPHLLEPHRDDVDLCLQVDRFDFAMRAGDEDGLLPLRKG